LLKVVRKAIDDWVVSRQSSDASQTPMWIGESLRTAGVTA
jgi:valyl-tRNA synthetase